MSNTTYHIAAWRFPWSHPVSKKPRYLLLGMRSQRIIIMAWSNHKIKPIQVESRMLYLNWASKRVRQHHTYRTLSYNTYKYNTCTYTSNRKGHITKTDNKEKQAICVKPQKKQNNLQPTGQSLKTRVCNVYLLIMFLITISQRQATSNIFCYYYFQRRSYNCQLTTKGNKI